MDMWPLVQTLMVIAAIIAPLLACVYVIIVSITYSWNKLRRRHQTNKHVTHTTDIPLNAVAQEDVRERETRQRIAILFRQQADAMKARAQKAHDHSCSDIFNCTKPICIQITPDSIVSQTTEARKTDDQRRKERRNGEVKIKSSMRGLKTGSHNPK